MQGFWDEGSHYTSVILCLTPLLLYSLVAPRNNSQGILLYSFPLMSALLSFLSLSKGLSSGHLNGWNREQRQEIPSTLI